MVSWLLVIEQMFTWSFSPQDLSVNLTQSCGQMSSRSAPVLGASSPVSPLDAHRDKSVVLKAKSPLRPPPLGCVRYTVTQSSVPLMECSFASSPPAPTCWPRPAHAAMLCPSLAWRWWMHRKGSHHSHPSSRLMWRHRTSECPFWNGRHNGWWWVTFYQIKTSNTKQYYKLRMTGCN